MGTLTASLQHDLDADVATMTLAGDLTFTSTPRVRSALLKCFADCPSAIVVDLRGVALESPVVLTVLPAVSRRSEVRPDVALLICMTGDAINNGRVRACLGSLPVYRLMEEALVAATKTRRLLRRCEFPVPISPDAPRQARQAVRHVCNEWELDHLTQIAELVTSELVTNAVRHARTHISLEVLLRGDFLHLRVRDGSIQPPQVRAEVDMDRLRDPGGHGLRLIDLYASGWGYVLSGSGKVVWATLRARSLANGHPRPAL
jgi:anti-sigma regulatory factor (Ser/Thr protein kinase)